MHFKKSIIQQLRSNFSLYNEIFLESFNFINNEVLKQHDICYLFISFINNMLKRKF